MENFINLDYVNKLKLPGFSPYRKKVKKIEEQTQESKLFGTLKRMYPEAKTFCSECFSPIFEAGGECPHCN